MAQKQTVSIPASLIPELEAWGQMTAKLFGRLRREANLQAVDLPDDQAWFWTKEWQAGEKAVDDALARGEYQDFEDAEGLIEALRQDSV
jgi:hypothetical protein